MAGASARCSSFANESQHFECLWRPCSGRLANRRKEADALGLAGLKCIQVAAFGLRVGLGCCQRCVRRLANYVLPLWCPYGKVEFSR